MRVTAPRWGAGDSRRSVRRPILADMTRRLAALAAAAAAVAALAVAAPAAAAPASGSAGTCKTLTIHVSLAQGQPANQIVSAEYCTPAWPAPGKPSIDVTVPGATYNHLYFDWPVQPALYNFADKAMANGQAVLDYDRIGTGASSHPPSQDVTLTSDAWVLHQVIAWARRVGYSDVSLIGHSLGSIIAAQDAGTWPADPTRLVLTGYMNTLSPSTGAAVAKDIYPADQDRPRWRKLDPGYLTTRPGVRASLFYGPGASPAVIAFDEAHKDVGSSAEVSAATALAASPSAGVTTRIRVPVLLMTGDEDAFYCGSSVNCTSTQAVTQHEQPYFTDAPSLTVLVVPLTGHDLALSPTASLSFQAIANWASITAAVGPVLLPTSCQSRSSSVHALITSSGSHSRCTVSPQATALTN
jgi:pimeloyl-ACP methyl ester carboxylesterase